MQRNDYPEHDKLRRRREEHEHIVAFVEWQQDTAHLDLSDRQCARMIAQYLDVNVEALEAEKRQMLGEIRDAE